MKFFRYTYGLLGIGSMLVLGPAPGLHAQDADVRGFQEIASRLDVGGDLFVVVHAGRWLDGVLSRLEAAGAAPPASAEERDLRDTSGLVRRFAARQGISGLQGFGVSSVPLQGGLSHLKVFLARDAQDANLPFWRGLFGWQPRRLLSLDFVPGDTGFVWASTPDFNGLWQLLENARQELHQPGLAKMLLQLSAFSLRAVEIEPAELLQSLRDELLLAGRFVPSAEDSASTTWEWLIVVGTGEQVLFRAVQQRFEKAGQELEDVMIGGHTLHRLPQQAEQPSEQDRRMGVMAFASVPGFLVVGNSSRMVEDALRAQRHRNGLTGRPEFVDAFRGQNMVNNGLLYIGSQGAQALRNMQDARVRKSLPTATDPFLALFLASLAGEGASGATLALTLANWRQGVMLSGRSGIGGAAIGSWLGSHPARWWIHLPHWLDRVMGE
jgi:hypothetical protein